MSPIIQLATIVVVGTFAQVLALRLGIPSIVTLLLAGVTIGPICGLVHPDELFGPLLNPLISLSVAFILFEGGMTLRHREFQRVGRTVLSLISVGTLLSWVMISGAAYWLLSLPFSVAVVFGAILVVSGPTVVIPLLHHLRPKPPLGSILRWEGILIDPVGVFLAVLVTEAVAGKEFLAAPGIIFGGMATGLVVGSLGGLIGGVAINWFVKRHLLPDHLQTPMTFTVVLGLYTICNVLHHESGLLAATVMGIVAINRGGAAMKQVADFTADLQVMLVALVFVILSARLGPQHLEYVNANTLLFVAATVLAIRPAVVFLSTLRSALSVRERLLLAAVAPRGIVAASLSSVLAASLAGAGLEGAELLLPYTFLTIIGTVLFYSAIAPPLCQALGLRLANPQGVLFVGAHPFARAFASALQREGFAVALVDTNERSVRAARRDGLVSFHGNAVSEGTLEGLELEGIGRMIALTSNDEANSLSASEYSRLFGKSEVFQSAPTQDAKNLERAASRGRVVFARPFSLMELEERWRQKHRIQKVTVASDEEAAQLLARSDVLPLAILKPKSTLTILSTDTKVVPKAGETLLVFGPQAEAAGE